MFSYTSANKTVDKLLRFKNIGKPISVNVNINPEFLFACQSGAVFKSMTLILIITISTVCFSVLIDIAFFFYVVLLWKYIIFKKTQVQTNTRGFTRGFLH